MSPTTIGASTQRQEEILGALGLGREDRRILVRVARAAGLDQAVSRLVSRGCFEAAATRYIERFGGHAVNGGQPIT